MNTNDTKLLELSTKLRVGHRVFVKISGERYLHPAVFKGWRPGAQPATYAMVTVISGAYKGVGMETHFENLAIDLYARQINRNDVIQMLKLRMNLALKGPLLYDCRTV